MNRIHGEIRRTSRPLEPGEVVQAGDIMLYGENGAAVIRHCKYDPGCCVGHVVESHERYVRPVEAWKAKEAHGRQS